MIFSPSFSPSSFGLGGKTLLLWYAEPDFLPSGGGIVEVMAVGLAPWLLGAWANVPHMRVSYFSIRICMFLIFPYFSNSFSRCKLFVAALPGVKVVCVRPIETWSTSLRCRIPWNLWILPWPSQGGMIYLELLLFALQPMPSLMLKTMPSIKDWEYHHGEDCGDIRIGISISNCIKELCGLRLGLEFISLTNWICFHRIVFLQ